MLLLELEGHGAVCSTAGQVAACLCSGCYKGIMVVVLVLVLVVVVVAVVLVVVTLARVVLVILVLVVLVVLLLMSIVVLLNAILLLSLHFVLKITFFPSSLHISDTIFNSACFPTHISILFSEKSAHRLFSLLGQANMHFTST